MLAEPPLPGEPWDEEARETAWRTIQDLLREGDEEAAALLMAQLNASGGKPNTSAAAQVHIDGDYQPYDAMDLYENLAYHYHFSDSEMRLMDRRRLQAYAWRLQRRLEKQNEARNRRADPAPETPEELEMEVRNLQHQGWRPQQAIPYRGEVVPVD